MHLVQVNPLSTKKMSVIESSISFHVPEDRLHKAHLIADLIHNSNLM